MLDDFWTDGPRILYCGTPQAGKGTNLRYLARNIPGNRQDSFEQIVIGSSRLLRFSILPTDEMVIKAFFEDRDARGPIAIYSLCGAVTECKVVEYLVKRVHAVVFISDARRIKKESNIRQMLRLKTALDAVPSEDLVRPRPLILQFNKFDLEERARMSQQDLEHDINWSNSPAFEATALTGVGVIATLAAAITVATRAQNRV